MFNNNSNNVKNLHGKTGKIVEKTKIKGDITTITDFRLDGELIGNFTSQGKLVIGENATLIGDVICKNMDVEGVYQGRAEVHELLSVRSKSKIKGEIIVGKLAVELGADFTANCKTQENIKNSITTLNVAKKPEEKAG